jgi:hypothetical protein
MPCTNNALESPNRFDHAERTITVDHSKQAFDILQEVGLFELNPITGELVPTVASMNASIHYPPAEEWEGIVSPCNGIFFCHDPICSEFENCNRLFGKSKPGTQRNQTEDSNITQHE